MIDFDTDGTPRVTFQIQPAKSNSRKELRFTLDEYLRLVLQSHSLEELRVKMFEFERAKAATA